VGEHAPAIPSNGAKRATHAADRDAAAIRSNARPRLRSELSNREVMTAPEGSTRSAGRRVGELLNHMFFTL
ncbi:MAG TPA: hypothetical protein VN888_13105, partial [Mycobacterium sp.]|nr:hypothetical protein [Mycobacterium sp.]